MSKYTAKELLKRMPKDYRQLSYKLYQEMLNNVLVEKPDAMDIDEFKFYQTYSMLSIILNIPIDELEAIPFITIQPLLGCLAFMDKEIPHTYSELKLKDAESLTYNEFQSLLKFLPEQWIYTTDILEIIIIGKNKEEIEKLSVFEVAQCFFQLRKLYKRSLAYSQISLGWKVMKDQMMSKLKKVIRIKD